MGADDTRQALNDEIDKKYYEAVLETAGESIDRARSSAELVEKAAASIGTLYAAVVGVTFSVTDHRLPLRGILPAFFLGAAIVGSMVYLSFLTAAQGVALPEAHTSPPERMQRKIEAFIGLCTELVARRSYFLRLSVVALALGVVSLSAPFIRVPRTTTTDIDARFPWPQATQALGVDPSLSEVVLQAQVDEMAARRRTALAETHEDETPVWILAGFAVVLMFLVPWAFPGASGRRDGQAPRDDDMSGLAAAADEAMLDLPEPQPEADDEPESG